MRGCMARASRPVLDGVEVPVKAKPCVGRTGTWTTKPEAKDMWRDAMGHLVAIEREVRGAPAGITRSNGDLGVPRWRPGRRRDKALR